MRSHLEDLSLFSPATGKEPSWDAFIIDEGARGYIMAQRPSGEPVLFPHPLLLCDIGGTNVRYSISAEPGAPAVFLNRAKTHAFPGLAQATRALLGELPIAPRSMIACAAGPAAGRSLKLTNADWLIDGAQVAAELGLEQGLTLNDFEAMAYCLPVLTRDDVRMIGQTPEPVRAGPRLVLGPGTGLGLSALIDVDGRVAAIPSEGGHVNFGPLGAYEEQLWPHLERAHGRITAESVMSGPGLERLHAARLAMLGQAPEKLTAAQITKAGVHAQGPERESLRLLWNLVARFAGDMALAFVARGGVTLAGGVLPRIVSLLDDQAFRAAFEDKAPMGSLVASIQTRLIVTDHAALSGMAAIGATPERYAIDYSTRLWR
jgi:glucokinase